MKLVARSHQSLIRQRTRHMSRLRSTPREYFLPALAAFEDQDSCEALELLAAAPDPDRGARLWKARLAAALGVRTDATSPNAPGTSTRRCGDAALRQPDAIQSAFAVITASAVRLISTLTGEIDSLGEVVAEHFGTLTSTPASLDSGDVFESAKDRFGRKIDELRPGPGPPRMVDLGG